MSLPVHLVDSADSLVDAAPGTSLTLEGDEAHHAVAVRRMRVGERLVLTDGAGTSVTAEIAATGKRLLSATVLDVRRIPEPAPAIVVVQALPKGDRGELAVEMLTEVGVARVVPWAASRSVAVWKGERAAKSLARWRATAREAAKQSRRSWFPVVDELASTNDVLALVADAPLAVVLHEEASVPLASLNLPAEGPLVIVVGPEGGLTDEEVAAFVAAGAASVRLGAEVLRTSTAGVAATAALLSRTPRWS
ncbi:16S rRNA (uracil(1498)-N(3))-methyltransferase [Nocardioides sp. dk4132]|uniref:16S rRNA (uracil(1498)-N(3))-methyltransferase n=1 Tax=unclassified Nocardioides TaxID=2615069 RepID=UPI0012952034|nr:MULTISPECIES: 16S rRNA (uracil(1498)-N(3))-methyltransferase [unclassified Nocardioides]MQW75431.1 16S rRNA (uracil(1498)-N(3))-methyltransferase [Nocardioides sp. dk4132]QGA08354.1 16S rRNA (uracil(1498)-N(3))-methyltransferase [Nocardioides sp. dk884]